MPAWASVARKRPNMKMMRIKSFFIIGVERITFRTRVALENHVLAFGEDVFERTTLATTSWLRTILE